MQDSRAALFSAVGGTRAGAELVALIQLHLRDVSVDQSTCGLLATKLQLSVAQVLATSEWLNAALRRAHDGEMFAECHGTNCTLGGAGDLSSAVAMLLQHRGISAQPQKVYCLSQCDHGPTLRSGDVFYLAGVHECRAETRVWRCAEDERPVSEA